LNRIDRVVGSPLTLVHRWDVECFDKDGNLKWKDKIEENLVVNTGLDEMLTQFWKGSTYTASFFVGLTDGTPTVAAADTMAVQAGWTEVTAFTEGVRQTLTLGSVASQSVDNSASKAVFSINGTTTVGGAFIATSATFGNNGILISAGAFTGGDRSLVSGDTLNVTATLTASSS